MKLNSRQIEIDELKAEVERLKEEREWVKADVKPTFSNDEDLYKYVIAVIENEVWTNVCYNRKLDIFQLDCDTSENPNKLNVTHWQPLPSINQQNK